jgi:hypothetical protein
MTPALALTSESADPPGDWLSHIFHWVGTLPDAIGPSFWFWVVVFLCGGGTLLLAPFRYLWSLTPSQRRKAHRKAHQRLEAQRQREIERAELKARHVATCKCGEDCRGHEKCEDHHQDCNCDHISFCACQDESNCECECRCDCRECDGYKIRGPLVRIPHGASAISTPAEAAPRNRKPKEARPGNTASEPQPMAWAKAREAFLEVSEQYVAYECDIDALVTLPALADVTFGPTATFVETFWQATQLLTDAEPSDPAAAERFVSAAERAINAWHAARKAAEHIQDTRFEDEERTLLRRVRHSLKLAENADNQDERAQAEDTAARLLRDLAKRTETSGRWRLPEKARLELDTWSRRHLPGGSASAQPADDTTG